MLRRLFVLAVIVTGIWCAKFVFTIAGGLTASAQTTSADAKPGAHPGGSHPGFQPAPEVPAMPKALMKFPRTDITRAKYPAVDFHLHGGSLKTAQDYQKMAGLMDQTNLAVICNMDGGF